VVAFYRRGWSERRRPLTHAASGGLCYGKLLYLCEVLHTDRRAAQRVVDRHEQLVVVQHRLRLARRARVLVRVRDRVRVK